MDPVQQVAFAARVVVAGTLWFSAWAKLRDLPGFATGVHAYRLLPSTAERIVVPLVPAAEVVLGLTILLGLGLPWTALATAGLFALFGAAILLAAHRGRDIPCHCFGASPQHRVGPGAALRSAVLVALALTAALPTSPVVAPLGAAAHGTLDGVAMLASLAVGMTLAVCLAEPVVLSVQGVRAAWRRAPALKAAEAARRKSCGAATP